MLKKICVWLLLMCTPVFAAITVPDMPSLTTPSDGDYLYIIDVSDTTDGPTGTGKKITVANLLGGATPVQTVPVITAFTNNKNTVEIGTTVTSTVLNWTVLGTPTSQSLDEGIGSISASALTYTDTTSYSTAKTYTLTATNSAGTDTADTTVNFRSKRYWGYSASAGPLNDAQIIALADGSDATTGSEFETDRLQTRNNMTPSAEYIYFAYPASWGTATFFVNNFQNNAWHLDVQNHVNASGGNVSFNVYHSNNLLTGTYDIVIE